jgi:cysteine synthase B
MKLHDLIGNTRLVELTNLSPRKEVTIFGKLEGDNPGGSVKDRTAYGMIRGALERGEIKKGDNLVEATSGNTGIALAMIARTMGLNMTLIMPDNA